jgi:hypothetical protein
MKYIKLAEQATTIEEHGWGASYANFDTEKFAELVEAAARADEREECAKLCESYLSDSPYSWGGTTMASAIRARGQA